MTKKKFSRTSILHYFKLIFRSGLFIAAVIMYIINRINNSENPFGNIGKTPVILIIIWLVFVVEMILRLFPFKIESMGCQKQFARNYIPTNKKSKKLNTSKSTFAIAAVWILLNGIIGMLYFMHIIDEGIMLLICMLFAVCDMICILFFCPFQTWFMKNKCCVSCRIYNWDYAMMFTPLIFIKGLYTWSILAIALVLLIKWEITYHCHPERFNETTNACLSCKNCTEKLCSHKSQLRSFLQKNIHLIQDIVKKSDK